MKASQWTVTQCDVWPLGRSHRSGTRGFGAEEAGRRESCRVSKAREKVPGDRKSPELLHSFTERLKLFPILLLYR